MFSFLRMGAAPQCALRLAMTSPPCTSSCSLLQLGSVNLQQNRGRKRGLKKGLSKQQRLERRLKREEKISQRAEHGFIERIRIHRMRLDLSQSQQGPGRLVREDESHLPDSPPTNIYLRKSVKTQFYPIAEALRFHREMQQPAIYNNPNAAIRLRLELNMTTERASKPIANSSHLIPVPFPFAHEEKRSILVFVQNEKLQELAIESGAELAVGADVVKKILKGQFRMDEYDFCVAHTDCAAAIVSLRGLLKSRFPTRLNGGLGENIPEMIEKFKNGVKMNVKCDSVYPTWGLSAPIVARLGMSDEEIEANIATIIDSLCRIRNPALGPFINRATMMVVPGDAYFALNIDRFLPTPTEDDIKRVEKYQKKKKKKDVKPAEEVEEDE